MKSCQRLVNFCQIGEILPNLVTLITTNMQKSMEKRSSIKVSDFVKLCIFFYTSNYTFYLLPCINFLYSHVYVSVLQCIRFLCFYVYVSCMPVYIFSLCLCIRLMYVHICVFCTSLNMLSLRLYICYLCTCTSKYYILYRSFVRPCKR